MGIDYGRSGCGPFDGMVGRRWIGYYLTAYGLAVKHGFVGTEKEWLESLIGTDGKSVDLRYNEETNTLQWRHQDAEEEWADLLDISTLQTQIVAETLADANAAKIAAEQANTQAQGAKQSSAASARQAADSAVQAKGSADAALDSATAAAKSEQSAKDYAGKPPIVQGDTWHTWNADSQSYTDTGIKASLTPKGEYSPDTAYTALDVVGYEGSSWLALQDVTGVAPAEGESWMLLAKKGDRGEQGIQGKQGIQGETGGPGPTGPQGASFTRLEKTAGTGAPGTIDTYTAYNSEGQAAGTVQVYNGMDGTGAGDFKADGTVPMTGDLQMAQHKVTGVADATEDGDAVNKGQMDAALEGVTVTTDAAPTEDSTNPVQSGGVFDALAGKADLTLSNLSNRQRALRNIGGRPNRNLLDNWYFVGGGSQQGGGQFPINQRGQTSYSGNGYGIDRWRIGSSGILTISADYIEFSSNDAEMRNLEQQSNNLSPGIYTLSFIVANGGGANVLCGHDGSYSSVHIDGDQTQLVLVTFTKVDSAPVTTYLQTANKTVKVYAAKLELGPTQTLAYQDEDGNWKLLEQPDPLELLKCQRYQFTFANAMRIRASRITNSEINFFIPLPTGLRTTPTIVNAQNLQVYSPTGGAAQTGFAFSCPSGSAAFGNGVTIVATKSSHGLQDAVLYTNTPGGSNLITLDANL